MGALQTLALFILTALAEIVGCYLPYLCRRPPAWRCSPGC
jgi:small multidrug resistance family-3 protein